MHSRAKHASVLLLYFLATLQFVRFYTRNTTPYLSMPAYLAGHERQPFQERVLPILFLRPMFHSASLARFFHEDGVFTADRGPTYLLSLVALLIAGFYTQKLYDALAPQSSFRAIVYPLFLCAMVWTYCIHNEADFSYPYDFPAVAFFAAGLFYIYTRKFLGVLLVVLIGTFNRETTLFLIGIYFLDSLSPHTSARQRATASFSHLLSSLNPRQAPWLRLGLLCFLWTVIKVLLTHHFAANDHSEVYLRAHYNIVRLRPRLFPALLNICGYTIPMVVLLQSEIRSSRYRSYLLILPFWVAVMFMAGVLVETRIYGELCPFAAVALVLILESKISASAKDHAESNGEVITLPEPIAA